MSKDEPGSEVILGKKFVGEQFATVRSVDDAIEALALHQEFGEHPDAIPLSVYFVKRRINDPVRQSMMLSFTKIRHAAVTVFDEIFSKF